MTGCKEVKNCRVCGGALEDVFDWGEQCLQGQFPGKSEPSPPRFPLALARCVGGCGLVQLKHTIRPELMFRDYWYRSGVTETMRDHLKGIALESVQLLGKAPARALDIGGNDGTLLKEVGLVERFLIDPCGLTENPGLHCVRDFYPSASLDGMKFDLVFTVACFYDADDPVAFARAVRDNLSDGGLWCVEVADLSALAAGNWSGVCHEHLCYYDVSSLGEVLARAGLGAKYVSWNACNGGSLRAYAEKVAEPVTYWGPAEHDWGAFAETVHASAERLQDYLYHCLEAGLRVHLLGASTKMNTVLQFIQATPDLVEMASDRDPRKAGRRTPGTDIPIVSEEESRAARPDVYLCGISHFRQEVVQREKDFLARGGRLVFALPNFEEVRR